MYTGWHKMCQHDKHECSTEVAKHTTRLFNSRKVIRTASNSARPFAHKKRVARPHSLPLVCATANLDVLTRSYHGYILNVITPKQLPCMCALNILVFNFDHLGRFGWRGFLKQMSFVTAHIGQYGRMCMSSDSHDTNKKCQLAIFGWWKSMWLARS